MIRLEDLKYYYYTGFDKPEEIDIKNVNIESNYLGDVTDEFLETLEEVQFLLDLYNQEKIDDTLEELFKNDQPLVYPYGIWVNPTKQMLEEYNISKNLDTEQFLEDF